MSVSGTSIRLGLAVACGLALAVFACGPEDSSGTTPDETIRSQEEFLKVCAGSTVTSGIDISHNNGVSFDLRAQKANGISFVYMKASDGITSQDADYVGFRKQADALGMLHGAYHFFEPGDDGTQQANNFLKAIAQGLVDGGSDCELPPVLDWEVVNGVAWSVSEHNAQAWLTAVAAATGQTPLIYTSSAFFPLPVNGTGGLPASFASYPLWVAQYGPTCPNINVPWTQWTIFQFGTANNTLDHDYYNGALSGLQGLDVCAGQDGGMDGGVGDGGTQDGGAPDGGPCLANGTSSATGNGSDCCSGPEQWNADSNVCGECTPAGQPSTCGCGSDCCGGHWPNGVGPNC
jgi:lysozyme